MAGKVNKLIQPKHKAVCSPEHQTDAGLVEGRLCQGRRTLVPGRTLDKGYLIPGSPRGQRSWPHKVWTSFEGLT